MLRFPVEGTVTCAIPQALGTVADGLLASEPPIQPVDVIAVK